MTDKPRATDDPAERAAIRAAKAAAKAAARAAEQVYVLMVEVGRAPEDGLPEGASGAALLCYASGRDEEHAVNETITVLREAGMAPLEVASYGTAEEQEAEGRAFDPEERALMARALAENAVIVADLTVLEPET